MFNDRRYDSSASTIDDWALPRMAITDRNVQIVLWLRSSTGYVSGKYGSGTLSWSSSKNGITAEPLNVRWSPVLTSNSENAIFSVASANHLTRRTNSSTSPELWMMCVAPLKRRQSGTVRADVVVGDRWATSRWLKFRRLIITFPMEYVC